MTELAFTFFSLIKFFSSKNLFALMQNHKTTKIIRHYLDVHSLFQIVYFTNIAVNLFCISNISESFMNLKIHQSLFSLLVTLCYPKNITWFSYRRTDWPTVACNQYLHSAQTVHEDRW